MSAKLLKCLIIMSLIVTMNFRKSLCRSFNEEYDDDSQKQEIEEENQNEWIGLQLMRSDEHQIEMSEEIGNDVNNNCNRFGRCVRNLKDDFMFHLMKRGGVKNLMRMNRSRNVVNMFNII